ncbi:hypothetical protein BT96DRAFT_1021504, partial [Gymnopus androsaceus JB14]
MSLFFKFLVCALIVAVSAKATLPAIGSLDESNCIGGIVTDSSYIDPDGQLVQTTVTCPNGIPALGLTTPHSPIEARQNNVCGEGCVVDTCFGPPNPANLDCDNLILLLQNNPGTFLAGASTTTQYSLGTCTCAFLSGVTQFECNESMAQACQAIQSACSSGPG